MRSPTLPVLVAFVVLVTVVAASAASLVVNGGTIQGFSFPVEIEQAKDKVPICHATSSSGNPFNLIEVNVNGLNGHGDHPSDTIPAPDGATTDDDCELVSAFRLGSRDLGSFTAPILDAPPPAGEEPAGAGGGSNAADPSPTEEPSPTSEPSATPGDGAPEPDPGAGGGDATQSPEATSSPDPSPSPSPVEVLEASPEPAPSAPSEPATPSAEPTPMPDPSSGESAPPEAGTGP